MEKAIQPDAEFTRAEAERRAADPIRRAALPTPETNWRIEGYEVDLVRRTETLIAEIEDAGE